ncbi:MAG TPA: glycerophosphodiester phosphodiesterase family protein [Membranihabitans sp.]|nr:glycerophosphodiester phosphodiesterase family protein [Membranihabitans sp.]
MEKDTFGRPCGRSGLLLWLCLLGFFELSAQDGGPYYLGILSTDQLQAFFQYREGDAPIISGHRGGMVPGMPENSIEAMEFTLQHTPAFFEIDPRLTKDSIIVLMHDVTLDRTTSGTGKLSDYTWEEVKGLRLKDKFGQLTDYKMPSLEEVIVWARGKTILNLDRKDVPPDMTVELIKRLDAAGHVMVTVHNARQARFYLDRIPEIMFSAFVRNLDEFNSYVEAGIPWSQVMAYVGPEWNEGKKELYDKLHQVGVKYMISTAPSADHLETPEGRAEAYRTIIRSGTDVIESDIPIEVARALDE